MPRAVLVVCFILAHSGPSSAGSVVYVDAAATQLPANGDTWCHAFRSLSMALSNATPGTVIYVAGGTYSPDTSFLIDPRTAYFSLKPGVEVYGGYAGCQFLDPNERDFDAHETILTGDLAGDDDPAAGAGPGGTCCSRQSTAGCDDAACQAAVCAIDSYCCSTSWLSSCAAIAAGVCCDLCGVNLTQCENAYHVIRTPVLVDRSTVLDGVTVTGGYASGEATFFTSAGGMRIFGSAVVRNCRVVDNVAMRAAALSHGDGNPLFENCLFANNTAFGDYAVVHSSRATFPGPHAQPEFNNCDFVGNRGDALELYAADARLTDCRIRGNSGLGLHATGVSIVQARNCLFERNSGGGLNAESPGTYLNCRFLANDASATFHGGGGAYVSGTPPVSFLNCEFGGNRAGRGGAALVQTIFGPTANAYFRNCTFHGNSASTSSGNLRADLAHITLENCIALGNTGLGGLALHLAQSSATVLYSNLQGGQMGVTQTAGSALNWGAGNSALDPLFVDAIGPDQIAGTTDDDLRLRPTSQLVDAGNPATVIDSAESDLDGHPRILCSRVDMGAYEFGLGDIDCDRAVDLDDFAFWPDCIGGPDSAINPPDCLAFDAQNDSDVDLRDVAGVFLHQSSD